MDDREIRTAAREIADEREVGEEILMQALKSASGQMIELIKHLNSSGARVEALKHHALYIGIGTNFMARAAPLAKQMIDDLEDETDKTEAQVTTGLWLAKVFKEIEKGIAKHEE